jgi:hypothetical protein
MDHPAMRKRAKPRREEIGVERRTSACVTGVEWSGDTGLIGSELPGLCVTGSRAKRATQPASEFGRRLHLEMAGAHS